MPLSLVIRLDAEGNQALPHLQLGFAVDRVARVGQGVPDVLEHQDQLLGADLPVSRFDDDLPQHLREVRIRDVRVRDVPREDGPKPRDRRSTEPTVSRATPAGPFRRKISEKNQRQKRRAVIVVICLPREVRQPTERNPLRKFRIGPGFGPRIAVIGPISFGRSPSQV